MAPRIRGLLRFARVGLNVPAFFPKADDAAETSFAHEGFPLPVSLQKIGLEAA
jgi:hypothetical protein